ncbi:MAG: 3,4-dihydroxy-2-butanone-4-phosphate synthase [Phycisphaerales bacterium]
MFSPIEAILADLRAGKMVILTDDESRENEGDLVLPAQFVSSEAITFMLSVARGYMCLSLTEADCDRLDLPPQATSNTSLRGTAFTVSIDGHPRHGFGTGVSAKDRARCIHLAIDPASGPHDFVRPGHINPLRSRNGGVLVRTGQTEGSLDLCRLAGLTPAAIIIEVMRDDGEMARVPDLVKIAQTHGLKMCSVAQIIEHRLARESLVKRLAPVSGTPIDTPEGRFNLIAFDSMVDPLPHIALTLGGVGDLDPQGVPIEHAAPTLVRMHRRNLLGDVFLARGEGGAPSGDALRAAMRAIQKEGRGAIVYLRPEGQADAAGSLEQRLQTIRRAGHDAGADTPDLAHPAGHAAALPESMRDFGVGGQILRALGLSHLRLLTNHPRELPGLEAFGLRVVGHAPLP